MSKVWQVVFHSYLCWIRKGSLASPSLAWSWLLVSELHKGRCGSFHTWRHLRCNLCGTYKLLKGMADNFANLSVCTCRHWECTVNKLKCRSFHRLCCMMTITGDEEENSSSHICASSASTCLEIYWDRPSKIIRIAIFKNKDTDTQFSSSNFNILSSLKIGNV